MQLLLQQPNYFYSIFLLAKQQRKKESFIDCLHTRGLVGAAAVDLFTIRRRLLRSECSRERRKRQSARSLWRNRRRQQTRNNK